MGTGSESKVSTLPYRIAKLDSVPVPFLRSSHGRFARWEPVPHFQLLVSAYENRAALQSRSGDSWPIQTVIARFSTVAGLLLTDANGRGDCFADEIGTEGVSPWGGSCRF